MRTCRPHSHDFDHGAVFPRAIKVRLISDVRYEAAGLDGYGSLHVEITGADPERPLEDGNKTIIVMEVRLAPIIGASLEHINIEAGLRGVSINQCGLAAGLPLFPRNLFG